MKYVVDLVSNNIIANMKKSKDESLFLVNGFEDLEVYAEVCKNISKAAKDMNKSIQIKLAKNKWNYFKAKYAGSPYLHLMEQNDWVSLEASTTYYRNQHNVDFLVLLGTEEEEDFSGSLNAIYEIRSDKLSLFMPKEKGLINYCSILDNLSTQFTGSEREVVNKLYKYLFTSVNENVCKLSTFWDEHYTQVTTINDFIKIFYENLPLWGVPKKSLSLPTPSQILKKNVLSDQISFIHGGPFKNFTPALYKRYKTKIEKYDEQGKEYSSEWDGWQNQNITNYSDFTKIILDYISGDRSDENKNKLLNFDYSIVESVLGLKLTSKKIDKTTVKKLYGSPLVVFSTAILNMLIHLKNEKENCSDVKITFTSAKIMADEHNQDDLVNNWKKICVHTNGVIERIIDNEYTLNSEELSISLTQPDFFKITVDPNDYVTRASSSKKMNEVNFKIECYIESNSIIEGNFLWAFDPNEYWLNSFTDLLSSIDLQNASDAVVPLTTLDKIESLITKKSEEEFFDYLTDKCNLDFSYNILESGNNINNFRKDSRYPEFYDLGKQFKAFYKHLGNYGIYDALKNSTGVVNKFIKSYKELAEKILKTKFNENEQYILDLFIHAFNIEKTNESIDSEKDIDCCIVPPWHPASLEKYKHMVMYFTDGCYQFWQSVDEESSDKKIPFNLIDEVIDELNQLSLFQNSVDLFPSKGSAYFGAVNSYGQYSLYYDKNLNVESNLRDLVKKEFVFDDEFKNNNYTRMNEDSKMLYGVLENYIRAFPNSKDKLNLVFINPSDLQPIISSVEAYITQFRNKYGDDKELSIALKILVKPENKGGKNYITYWMDKSFDIDSNVKIKTYLNVWKNKEELEKLLNSNNDIIFVMDLLKASDYEFINKIDHYEPSADECYYPIVFRPSPVSNTSSKKRRIEITQPQFTAEKVHTQVVHYKRNLETIHDDLYYAVKTVSIDEDIQKLVKALHEKSYWVVCVDASMDVKLLKDNDDIDEYSVIGFSTGKGTHGQYNLTITARSTILKSIEINFAKRLTKMFGWNNSLVMSAAKKCMNEASHLDGISVLTASNMRDYNVNEFMAYVLTSMRDREHVIDTPLSIIVHLDSYKHWFDGHGEVKTIFDEEFSKSRPDFLKLTIDKNFENKIKIHATVIECKTASINNKQKHISKAAEQVEHGIEVLSNIFDPYSKSLKRRYWYAQLYRALAFAQVSFNDSSTEFSKLSNKLRGILNGEFDIEWDGEVLGYWLDMVGEDETTEILYNGVTLHNIPQKRIQKIILDDHSNISYVHMDESIISDEYDFSKKMVDQENIIDAILHDRERINKNVSTAASVSVPSQKKEEKIEVTGAENQVVTQVDKKEEVLKQALEQKVIIDSGEKNDVEPNKKEEQSVTKDDQVIANQLNKKDVRVLIGNDKAGKKVYWEFGHPQLANRHLLITGTSGQGKTYCIQTMLYELTKQNISSVIFDYTEGFTNNQLEPEFLVNTEDKINEHIVYYSGVPINPFKRHEIEMGGKVFKEKEVDVATRLANILKHVYGFGDQQFSAIFNAVRIGMRKYGDHMNIQYFQQELENLKSENPAAKTVISKMEPFFYSVDFVEDSEFDWDTVLYSGNSKINIFQLTRIDRQMQVIITELMLWDAWYYTQKVGTKDKPFVVVLDEAQNLSHKQTSPSAKILTEGRKFGWSAWFATQSLKVLDEEEVIRLMQAAFKLYFKPTDDELVKIAKQIDPTDGNAWLNPIKNLTKGQSIVIGNRVRDDGSFGTTKPTVTSVSSFRKRVEDE